ncbi:MAG: oligosaccharide repeat unit polymerase [Fibrobacteres bacterium]|jgi:oligosaccharide repeat unit polymerase|nr:oligosaccharide repeat unit polymerase [Fibrobacterota bacterium]
MTWLMLAVLAATLVTAFRPGFDLLSPSRIYICVYALLLAFYHLNLSRLQTPWSLTSNLLFYGASALFLAGGLWVWIAGKSKNPDWRLDFTAVRDALRRDSETVDWPWFRRVYAICILGFLISFGVSMAIVGGLPAFMKDPDDARIKFFSATQITNYGIFLGPISLMLGMVLLWFSNPSRAGRRWILASLAFVLVLYMSIVTRYDLFRFLIFSVVLYHYGRKPLRFRHVLVGLFLGAIVFFAAFLIRVNTSSMETFNEMIQVKMPKHLAWASNIYAYLANDFWNYDFAVTRYVDGDRHYPLQYGLGLFRALLWNLHLEGPLDDAFHFDTLYNESAARIKGLNTVVYVWHFYKDFGIAGALLLPLAAGLLAWKFYFNTMLTPTIFRVGIWGILAGVVALSYHTPLWELWFLYLNLLVFFIAHRRVKIT